MGDLYWAPRPEGPWEYLGETTATLTVHDGALYLTDDPGEEAEEEAECET